MNSAGDSKGFTLIELVVVISLISLALVFTMPRFQGSMVFDQTNRVSRWIMLKVSGLKEQAMREKKTFALHIGLDTGQMWVTHEGMDAETLAAAMEKTQPMPSGLRITDVEFSETGRVALGEAVIRFYPQGYSDKAMIHMEDEDGEEISFLIESFLPRVKRFESYVSIED